MTSHPKAIFKKSSTSAAIGALPLVSTFTFPPNKARILPKTRRSQRKELLFPVSRNVLVLLSIARCRRAPFTPPWRRAMLALA